MAINTHRNLREIILTETNSNKRGDLFNRLTFDVMHSLGFEKPQFDIQMAGHEIDMIAPHRTENRVAILECKSQKDKVGGADLNKFYGALDLEACIYESKKYRLWATFYRAQVLQPQLYNRKRNAVVTVK